MTVKFQALVDYEDAYVQPLIMAAVAKCLPAEEYALLDRWMQGPDATSKLDTPLLQFRAYESLDFDRALSRPYDLMNTYVIRKALIRKHYLSNTIFSWVTKHPDSPLAKHFTPAVDFELDYAEFLDDALVEAFELRASFERNEGQSTSGREWWILKPGMSDRGQGIRLFSTEDELLAIFEGWEADQSSSEDGDDDENDEDEESSTVSNAVVPESRQANDDYVVTSHLRHFIAQPYVHPPLLIPEVPFNNRKFHIRTYVVAAGALRVYVFEHMLALFASEPYTPPWDTAAGGDEEEVEEEQLLSRLRNVHLTNTCVQTSCQSQVDGATSQQADPVHLLSSLPLPDTTHAQIQEQICSTTGELFRAALAHPTNFQPLPQAFEIFGVDFLVRATEGDAVNVQLLEVNAFPDFAQTGDDLRELVVKGLFEAVFTVVIGPHFGVTPRDEKESSSLLKQVLDLDMGR